jgi:glycosyltransferase involved in cell wall biosynthesis
MHRRFQNVGASGQPVAIKNLVILVRADPVICGHATEARNVAEAAHQSGCKVHIVTWPLQELQRAGLPLKAQVENYSPGIHVHRPDPIGDEKVLDGRLLQGMAGRIVELLLDGGGKENGFDEVDVILSMYLSPHCQIASLAAQSLDVCKSSGVYKRRLVTIAKAVGSDVTSQIAECLRAGTFGGALIMLSQFLDSDILQAVSLYTKDVILESSNSVDKALGTTFTRRLADAIEISYPPIDTDKYSAFAEGEEMAMATSRTVCSKYNVGYGRFVFYVSRIMPAKGVDDLVRAYLSSKVHEAGIPLIIAGDGPDAKEIQRLASPWSSISVIGPISDEDKVALLHACSVSCLPSKPTPSFVETFGIAIVEKMLAGGPGIVVTTRTGGIPEASGGPGCCIEVEHSSVESIRAGLEKAAFMPDLERTSMVRQARAHAQRFHRMVIWEEIESSIIKVTEKPASGSFPKLDAVIGA